MRLPRLRSAARNGTPVYRQIAQHVRDEIAAGRLAPGEKLPPIRALARDLDVNRDTVALAYEALVGEGLLEAGVGRGTFVRERSPASAGEPPPRTLSPAVERLLAFENARPRFGNGSGVAALHALIPDPSLYPLEPFRRALDRALARGGADLFVYGGPGGHPGLRAALAERFRRAGIERSPHEIVLCHGASQGISLALRLFASSGDEVAVEAPTYHNVLATLLAHGVTAVPVEMDAEGPDLGALDRVLARPEVKAFYTIPSFHNPLGTSASLQRRRGVLDVAARHGVPVLEDAFEMDLRYAGRALPPLAALDAQGLVVHLFSFSKSLFPGVRVGSIAARGRTVEGLLALKHATDLSDSLPLQAALEEFVRGGDYDRHLHRLRRILRARRDALLAALEAEMPAGTRWTRPDGGYQVWVELGSEMDTRDLLADAAREGVLFAPGAQFSCDGRPSRGLRLTVAQADEDEIRRGVAALGRVVRERSAAAPERRAASVHV